MCNKKGKELARRMHGCELVGRWNGQGLPPVIKTVPNRGAPTLERNPQLMKTNVFDGYLSIGERRLMCVFSKSNCTKCQKKNFVGNTNVF